MLRHMTAASMSLLTLCGCVSDERQIGYISPYSEGVIYNPVATESTDSAVMQRDALSNRLDIRISAPYQALLLTSFKHNYEILIRFGTAQTIPVGSNELFIPAFYTEHISILGFSVSASKRALELRLSADRLGADRIIASITAPGGVKGILLFPNATTSLPLRAQAFEAESFWGRLSTKHDLLGRTCLGFENASEFHFIISNIRSSRGETRNLRVHVPPGKLRWKCFKAPKEFSPVSVASRMTPFLPSIAKWPTN